MSRKFIRDITFSSIQTITNQFTGFFIFIILSTGLSKEQFGEFNWTMALILVSTSILTLRLEQIVTREVAKKEDPSQLLTLFFGHILIAAILFVLLIIGARVAAPKFFQAHYLVIGLSVSQVLLLLTIPFKVIATGMERFGSVAVMSIVANITRLTCLIILITQSALSIQLLIIIYLSTAAIELFVSFSIVTRRLKISFESWSFSRYKKLIKSSTPHVATALLNAGIARIDWIIIGILTTGVATAEYTFAYKIFELSPFLLMILAPLLLSKLSRLLHEHTEEFILKKKPLFDMLIRSEVLIASFIGLLINIGWVPVFDALTSNKYGSSNQYIFLILSVCIPIQFLINLTWTIHFSLNRLKFIFRVTAISFSLMLFLDLLLIPLYGGIGAAIAYLAAQCTEYILLIKHSVLKRIKASYESLLIAIFNAFATGVVISNVQQPLWVKLITATILYFILAVCTRLIVAADFIILRKWAGLKLKLIETNNPI